MAAETDKGGDMARARRRWLRSLVAALIAVAQLHLFAADHSARPAAAPGAQWPGLLHPDTGCAPSDGEDRTARGRFCALCALCVDAIGPGATSNAPSLVLFRPTLPGGAPTPLRPAPPPRAAGWASSWSAQSPPRLG
jgi:hypothetical protein